MKKTITKGKNMIKYLKEKIKPIEEIEVHEPEEIKPNLKPNTYTGYYLRYILATAYIIYQIIKEIKNY